MISIMVVFCLLENLIAKENPKAVEHDMQIIDKAHSLHWDEDGWDELQSECMTDAARCEIHNIEMRKYHSAEYACGML